MGCAIAIEKTALCFSKKMATFTKGSFQWPLRSVRITVRQKQAFQRLSILFHGKQSLAKHTMSSELIKDGRTLLLTSLTGNIDTNIVDNVHLNIPIPGAIQHLHSKKLTWNCPNFCHVSSPKRRIFIKILYISPRG